MDSRLAITIYTYGVLLAAAYLLGLKLAMVRAKARGLDQTRVLDLGIYIIISALVGAKLLLLVTDFRTFRRQSARAADARALGRRVLRRPDPRRRRRALVHPPRRPAAVDDVRRVRAGHRARPRRRPVRLFLRGLLLRQADERALGDHVHRSLRRRQRRHAAERSAAPDAAVRGGRRSADSAAPARHRTARPAVPWSDVLAVHPALRDLAVTSSSSSAAIRAERSAIFSTSQFISISCWRRSRSACWSILAPQRRNAEQPQGGARKAAA